MIISYLKRILGWVLLLGLTVLLIGGAIFVFHVETVARQHAERLLAKSLTNLKVKIGGLKLTFDGAILVHKLQAWFADQPPPSAPFAELGQVEIHLAGGIVGWIRGERGLKAVRIRGAKVEAIHLGEGEWNLMQIRWQPSGTVDPPEEITVEESRLNISDGVKCRASIQIRSARIVPRREAGGTQPKSSWEFAAQCESAVLGAGTFSGQFRGESKSWRIELQLTGIPLASTIQEVLPPQLLGGSPPVKVVRGQARLEGSIIGGAEVPHGWQCDLRGSLDQVSLELASLPQPISELSGQIFVSRNRLLVEGLEGTLGGARLRVPRAEVLRGPNEAELYAQGELRNLELDPRFAAIHPQLARIWAEYQPGGKIHLGGSVRFDGRQWRWNLVTEAVQASLCYAKLPYPIGNVRGWLLWNERHLWVDLVGSAGTREVFIRGRSFPKEGCFFFTVSGQNIPVDDTLLGVIPPGARAAVSSLHPEGDFDFGFISRRLERFAPTQRELWLSFQNASVRYERFPYPIQKLRGLIRMRGTGDEEYWWVERAQGTHSTGRITLGGELFIRSQKPQIVVSFQGEEVPLDEELRQALPTENLRQLWLQVNPRGKIRRIEGQVRYPRGEGGVDIAFMAVPDPQDSSVEPVWFPYRLEGLEGQVQYENGRVQARQFRGRRAGVEVTADIACQIGENGAWQLSFTNIFAERVPLDRDLFHAMPDGLKQVLFDLNPVGVINVRGDLTFTQVPAGPLETNWQLAVDTHQARLDCGLRFEQISGTIALRGSCFGTYTRCLAELDLTAANTLGVQLTEIRGPLWIEPPRVICGFDQRPQAVPTAQGIAFEFPGSEVARPLTMQCCGGTVTAQGWVLLGEVPRYQFHVDLGRADLPRLCQDLFGRADNLRGTVYAQAELAGSGWGLEGLMGSGTVQLRNADIYELPLMIALLKILSVREPDRSAFSTADITFRLERGRIYLPYLAFSGDAISLEGSGEMDWQGRIELVFRALLGRAERQIPVLRELIGGASQQIMVLHVTGTLHDPFVASEPFPMVNQVLQQLQAETPRKATNPAEAGLRRTPPRESFPHFLLPWSRRPGVGFPIR